MMKYKKRKGMKVVLYNVEQTETLGIGKYIDSQRVRIMGHKFWCPRFKLGRKHIWGFECWWIPVNFADKEVLNKGNL